MRIKKLLRTFGYDIQRYHSLFNTTLAHYHIRTIIDIGANDGYWSKEMRTLFPDTQIYAFEPLKDCFERLTARFCNDTNFTAYNVALGSINGTSEIERSSFHPSSSLRSMTALHKTLYPKSANITHEHITICTLDSLKDLSLKNDVLIKMDVQGFEDEVIIGGRQVLSQAAVIVVETSFVTLYEHQPLFGDIHEKLTELGFVYRGNCGEHFSRFTGEKIYEDSIFVKNPSQVKNKYDK